MRARAVIDYSLARRALLADLFSGRVSTLDVCDAHPYLLRAAKYHGEPTATDCPVCKKEKLTYVTYLYGDELKDATGQVRATSELPAIEQAYAEVTVYVVEVCRTCGWNHLATSYLIGTAGARRAAPRRRSRRTAEASD